MNTVISAIFFGLFFLAPMMADKDARSEEKDEQELRISKTLGSTSSYNPYTSTPVVGG